MSTLQITKRKLGLTSRNSKPLKINTAPNPRKGKKFEWSQGIKNKRSKLNDDKVREIRVLLGGGRSCTSIGKLYNVSNVTIANIRDKKIWTHVA